MQRVKSNNLYAKKIIAKNLHVSTEATNGKKYMRIRMSMNRKDGKFQFIPFSFYVRQTVNGRIPREERNVALEMEKFSSRRNKLLKIIGRRKRTILKYNSWSSPAAYNSPLVSTTSSSRERQG